MKVKPLGNCKLWIVQTRCVKNQALDFRLPSYFSWVASLLTKGKRNLAGGVVSVWWMAGLGRVGIGKGFVIVIWGAPPPPPPDHLHFLKRVLLIFFFTLLTSFHDDWTCQVSSFSYHRHTKASSRDQGMLIHITQVALPPSPNMFTLKNFFLLKCYNILPLSQWTLGWSESRVGEVRS